MTAREHRWPEAMRALAHRPFRYYFAGQAVSVLGAWIRQVALSWLVYRLTGSAALLGATVFTGMIPMLLVGPIAGAWIDRHDKRRLLMYVQILLFCQAAILATLTYLDLIGPTLILVMSAMLGILNAVDTPLRQSLIGLMIPHREDLPNALALNAMLFNIGRFIGPPIAGLLLGVASEATCFALNAVSYLALFAGVFAMPLDTSARASGSVGHVFREGVRYALETFPVRTLIVTLAFLNVTASAYAVLLPIFAKEIFHGDARTLGLLWGAAGAGAFASTVFLATRKGVRQMVNVIIAGVPVAAIALLVFPLSRWLPLSLLALAAIGFSVTAANVSVNAVLQTVAPEHLRGRVVSFFSGTRFGFDAIGGLMAGAVAVWIGAPWTVVAEAVVLVIASLWLLANAGRLRTEISH